MSVANDVELISIPEAVKRFGLSRQTLYAAMEEGTITRYERELGKTRIFVDAKEVERKLRPRPAEGNR